MPKEVTFFVSEDGEKYRQIAQVPSAVAFDDYTPVRKDLGTKVNTTGRYVKIIAKNFGTIPDWHLGAGGKAWLFIDEVIIE